MKESLQDARDPIVERAQARVGAVLSRKYRLERLLGVGGMAAVYSATHLRNAGRVAIKIMQRELSVDRDLRARFLREGYAANIIDHPGAVRALDDELADDGAAFLVMELLDGETLDARWERSGRRLRVGEVVTLMIELLDVLAAAHAKGIVHRDIKPENLFLCRDGALKVLDFGIARLGPSSPTKTKSGAIFGTPAFMAPEQALGRVREVDQLSDVFAVGATAFSLLTGRFVHQGETPEELAVRAATTPPPTVASIILSVPEPIAHVIDTALCFDRSGRWPSALAMREALVRARDETILATADDFDDEVKTRLAPAPKMTLHPDDARAARESTLPLPTLPAASTVGGVSSDSRRRHGLRLAAVAAVCRAAVEGVRRIGLVTAMRRAGSTIVALARTNALRHPSKLLLAAVSGLLASFVVAAVLVLVARGGGRGTVATAASAPAASSLPVADPTPVESSAADPLAPSAAPAASDQGTAIAAPPGSTASATTMAVAQPADPPVMTTHRPTALPAPPTPPRPRLRPKHDPLAP